MKAKQDIPFGTQLRSYRRARGFTQEELAERAGMSPRGIRALERGERTLPRRDTIDLLADALGLAEDERAAFGGAARSALPDERDDRRTPLPRTRPVSLPRPGLGLLAVLLALLLLGGVFVAYRSWAGRSNDGRALSGPLVVGWGQSVFHPPRLVHPGGIATDGEGRVYVLDSATDRVYRFSSTGKLLGMWGKSGSGHGQLQDPTALAVDVNHMVYVADTGNHRVQKFTTEGTLVATWTSTGPGADALLSPTGIAVDPQGYIYVSDAGNGHVLSLSPHGRVVQTYSTTYPTTPFSPRGLAVDTTGTLYVLDPNNAVVYSVTPGSSPRIPRELYTGAGDLTRPVAVAVDGRGHIYVTDNQRKQVVEFEPLGPRVRGFGSYGKGRGQFRQLGGVAIGRDGDVYVTDVGSGRVERFSPSGRFLDQWGPLLGPARMHPQAVASDARGDVYVADELGNRVIKMSPSGTLLASWGGPGDGAGQFEGPTSLAIDVQQHLFVVDSRNRRIQKLSREGRVLKIWGSRTRGLPPDPPWRTSQPVAVAVDTNGRVYVADTKNDELRVYTPDGRVVGVWTHLGFGTDPQVTDLSAVAMGPQHQIYVGDAQQGEVSVLSSEGALLRQWRAPGVEALAIDAEGRTYAACGRQVIVFSSSGNRLGSIGDVGRSSVRWADAAGITVALNRAVYVADVARGEVYAFAPPQ